MTIKTITALLSIVFAQLLMAHDLPINLPSGLEVQHKVAIENALLEVANLLPLKIKKGLPANLELRFEKLSDHQFIPHDICVVKTDKTKKLKPFVYGEFHQRKNVLILNTALLNELLRGRINSVKINCQHKNLYDQAIATIIHELTHAYDFHNGNLSRSNDFILKVGFKKGLLKSKNKNIDAMRSADPYELKNLSEAYAVNLEYFVMDPEFACRRPAMFEYFKRTMELDPFPKRICQQSNTVMMSTASGLYPVKLDSHRVYRIDYLLASAGTELSSGFGHSMFRIILCAPERFDPISNKMIKATPFGAKCLEDKLFHLVVSYRANVEDATMNYLKGIFGGYPSMLFILSFSDVLDEYNRDELRDVESFPLKLSLKEKNDFINKVLEEHWNYRGSYKFITNNCAVESYDLLKGALETSVLQSERSLTPVGVLEDLERLEFLSLKNESREMFKARTDQLIQAHQKAYGAKKSDSKNEKKALLQFISKSTSADRLERFNVFTKERTETNNLHTELVLMKKALIKASSFSVLEQQILRSETSVFRKKAAEVFMKADNADKIKKLLQENGPLFNQNFSDLAFAGYGVPLLHEIVTPDEVEQKREQSKEVMASIETGLKELMPKEIANLGAINSNIGIFNQNSLALRKLYREKLDVYIRQQLIHLSQGEESRVLLINSLTSKASMDQVRELLDISLVGPKEILDAKLRELIEQIFKNE